MAATDTHAPLIEGFVWGITGLCILFDVIVNASLVQKIVMLGYGNHVVDILEANPVNFKEILIYLQVISGLVRLSTNVARVSFAATLLQLSNKKERRFVWFAITTLLAVTTPAIIFPFVSCRPYARIFDPSVPGTCINGRVSIDYFIFEGAYTAFIDFALVALPWRILSKLQLRRVEKLGASLAMSLGVLSGVVTLVKASYTTRITDMDWTYSSIDLTMWNIVEPASVIIAASVPNLRVFALKNSKNLKESLKFGSGTRLGSRGKSRKADDIYLDNVQSTIKAISAGTDKRRGEGKAWITSREAVDDDSAKSILHEAMELPASGIVQTSTFTIEYPEETHTAPNRKSG
ncbi:hypothetical protein EKO27_g6337 [Xylaria grammica]|uniref:Rhodopsin domain-containing protein n=1 Tax=Xylaria grammica TaxID=363999 RepID=A0A439D3B1_9PEZI|nr:hypothetical protein EKO27_g6337 [Xylaria grammica]